MKELLKNQAGAVIVVIIIVLVLATAGGGAAFLAVRMVVSGDGNFLQPFEELGWIDPKEDSSSEDKKADKKEDKEDKSKTEEDEDEETTTSSQSGNTSEYLVEDSRLSSDSKKSGISHYYGKIDLGESMGDADDEYADLYRLLKAGINLYANDEKVTEIEFGFDITEFCEKAFEQYPDDFKDAGMNSAEDIQEMMMSAIETMFDAFDEEYSDYVTKYIDGGVFQMYVTERGFESLYETYDIEEGENDLETLKSSLEDTFNTEISLVR